MLIRDERTFPSGTGNPGGLPDHVGQLRVARHLAPGRNDQSENDQADTGDSRRSRLVHQKGSFTVPGSISKIAGTQRSNSLLAMRFHEPNDQISQV